MRAHANKKDTVMGSEMVNTDVAEARIQQLLEPALIAAINELNANSSNDSVYAVVVYCASGCASMGLAFNTREWLDAKSASPDASESPDYYELHASQWKELNYAYAAFADVNENLDTIFDDLYEADLSDDELSQLFVRVVTRTIHGVDFNKRVQSAYQGDLLLGMQFGDPSQRDWQAALDVSRQVNSAQWHARLASL